MGTGRAKRRFTKRFFKSCRVPCSWTRTIKRGMARMAEIRESASYYHKNKNACHRCQNTSDFETGGNVALKNIFFPPSILILNSFFKDVIVRSWIILIFNIQLMNGIENGGKYLWSKFFWIIIAYCYWDYCFHVIFRILILLNREWRRRNNGRFLKIRMNC